MNNFTNQVIIASLWFTQMGNQRPIGIVIVERDGKREAYIGTGKGLDQKSDEVLIAERGAKFSPCCAREFLTWFPTDS